MEGSVVLNAGFVVAAVAFLRDKLNLRGNVLLAVAFLVALLTAEYPLILAALPNLAPWLEKAGVAVVVFVTAVGSVDFANYVKGAEVPKTKTI